MLQKVNPYLLVFIAVALFHIILSKPLANLDKSFTDIQFEVRGETKIDSSIITLYIDNAIMDSLGRVPLKWIYYAKLIDALSDLKVKAIGIDMVFDKNSPDYPTQASWLVTSIRNSGRVCVGGVFNKINNPSVNDTVQAAKPEPGLIAQNKSDSSGLYVGADLEVPFPWLLKNAAGFGHLNFEESIAIRKVPLVLNNMDSSYSFLKSGEIIPALALELLRIYLDLPKDSISVSPDRVVINDGDSSISIPADSTQMMINYCGGINSLNMISISDFLNMYKLYLRTRKIPPELERYKDKIVLIGLTAKRTSQFASTPYDNKFPLIGIHANVLDTIIRQRFLHTLPNSVIVLLSALLAGAIFFFTINKKIKYSRSVLISTILLLIYLTASFLLFRVNIILSAQPLIVGLLALIGSGIYQLNNLQLLSKSIEREKHSIESMLDKSKQKILRLEESLTNYKIDSNENIAPGLIQDYHSELTDLANKFDDLSEYKKKNNNFEKIEFNGIVFNKNSKMEEVTKFSKKIAPTDATVLLIGESGTGKELIAKAIHDLSGKKENNFVTINCGAIPETLLESELFGHEEGAYTGANKQRKGYFESADKGTIFLDEITETNEMFQTKLLRVLQSGEFNRVGGSEPIKVDVRIIAASNKNIEELVKEKKFREDLYYRLNVIKISLPPLRARKSDIPVLIDYFLEREDASNVNVSNSAMEALLSYDWPGNIRQLENVIKRSAILAKVENNNIIRSKNLPPEIIGSLKENNKDIEERIIDKLREKEFSHSSISDVAAELGGLHRSTVAEYLRGVCFREFCIHQFNIENAAISIAGTDDDQITKKVQSKTKEYLNNLMSNIDREMPVEQLTEKLNFKFKKLPNRYHPYLNKIIGYFYDSEFKYLDYISD